jgi:hypothetical protein
MPAKSFEAASVPAFDAAGQRGNRHSQRLHWDQMRVRRFGPVQVEEYRRRAELLAEDPPAGAPRKDSDPPARME